MKEEKRGVNDGLYWFNPDPAAAVREEWTTGGVSFLFLEQLGNKKDRGNIRKEQERQQEE